MWLGHVASSHDPVLPDRRTADLLSPAALILSCHNLGSSIVALRRIVDYEYSYKPHSKCGFIRMSRAKGEAEFEAFKLPCSV